MFGIGAMELVVILILALIIFGPGKLPEVGKAVGRAVREFKKATSDVVGEEDSKLTGSSGSRAAAAAQGGTAGAGAQAAHAVRTVSADDRAKNAEQGRNS